MSDFVFGLILGFVLGTTFMTIVVFYLVLAGRGDGE